MWNYKNVKATLRLCKWICYYTNKSVDEVETIIKLIKGLIQRFTNPQSKTPKTIQPRIIPRALHSISRAQINRNALKVLYRLHEGGYSAYLVGGCVRDLLLGLKPKDFDIATDAHPDEVRRLFKNCRLIGRRFRLAHILFGPDVIEVATFRSHHGTTETEHHAKSQQGMILRDNVYGTIEDDAWRRDFRINALYYNIADFSVVDYTGGMQDIEDKVLHIIGDPEQRFHEDPVRLLRAVRFAAKCDLQMTENTEMHLNRLNYLLGHVSPGRLYQEVLKFFQEGKSLPTIHLMQRYQLFEQLFPVTAQHLNKQETHALLEKALKSTDQRIVEGKTVSPAFLFAVFLWHPVHFSIKQLLKVESMPLYLAFEKSLQSVMKIQTQVLAIPRVMQVTIRDICFLQQRFHQRRGSQPYRILQHPRFRAAYDLLLLRKEIDQEIGELADWWTEFNGGTLEKREQLLKDANKRKPKPRVKKRKPHQDQSSHT